MIDIWSTQLLALCGTKLRGEPENVPGKSIESSIWHLLKYGTWVQYVSTEAGKWLKQKILIKSKMTTATCTTAPPKSI